MVRSFLDFIRKVCFGHYDQMTWEDIFNLVLLLGIITAVLYAAL